MGWTIDDAVRDDAAPLARILGDWVREVGWMPVLHSRDEDEAFVSGMLDTHRLRVVRLGRLAAGFLANRQGHIDALYLCAPARGQGIGRALLDEVKATEGMVELWTFQANARARAFYLREGFHEAEKTDGHANEAGLPDIRLVWKRAP